MPPFQGTTGDDLIFGTDEADTIEGLAGNDRLFGSYGDDTLDGGDDSDLLDGGPGRDTMIGGNGDDYYVVDNARDIVTEAAAGGFDLVFTTTHYILPANVERLAAYDPGSTYALTLIGNSLANEIIGNNGQNILDGGGGADLLRGGGGDDQYVVSLQGNVTIGASPSGANLGDLGNTYLHTDAPDVVAENSNGGTDTIWVPFTGSTSAHSWFDYTLLKGSTFSSGQVERLGVYDRTSVYAVNLQGDVLNNQIFGNEGVNILDGWTGADVLSGYGGDDIYFVDDRNDSIVESAGGGYDTVFLTSYPGQSPFAGVFPTSYTLPANVDRVVGSASYVGNLIGNDLANEIIGNANANTIFGGDAGTASDILRGGAGDDQYRLEAVPQPGALDLVVEFENEGYDLVITTYSYTLTDNVEALMGKGVLTGNDLNNAITGADASNDTLDGRAGADTLTGKSGDDVYFVDNVADSVVELAGGGYDSVFATFSYTISSNIERLGAADAAGTDPLNFTGNDGDNEIWGNAGANVIDGKFGPDVLHGFGGADTFAFTSSLFGSGADQIVDFEPGIDKIGLDDAIFTALAPGALPAGAFTTGTTAQDADDRIIHDPTTGWLWYDRDGSDPDGVPIHFATVHEGLTLSATDFIVI
jgi:Ca2+-binding RTX toxin-like protein